MNPQFMKISKFLLPTTYCLLLLLLPSCSQAKSIGNDFLVENHLQWCDLGAETNSLIITQACDEVVELSDDSYSDLEKIGSLREWVSSWWPYSRPNVSNLPSEYWKVEPEELFRGAREGRYGGLCGSTAWMLMHVYHKFGLETWIYNFGNPAGIGTHVVTLVKVEGVVILQDAYLNAELSQVNGSEIDLRSAMNLSFLGLGEYKFTSVYKEGKKRCLGSSLTDCAERWISKPERDVVCKLKDTSRKTYLCDVSNFSGRKIVLDKTFWSNVEDFLHSQNFNPRIETLMLFPINLTGSDGIAITDANQIGGTSQVLFNEILSASKGRF